MRRAGASHAGRHAMSRASSVVMRHAPAVSPSSRQSAATSPSARPPGRWSPPARTGSPSGASPHRAACTGASANFFAFVACHAPGAACRAAAIAHSCRQAIARSSRQSPGSRPTPSTSSVAPRRRRPLTPTSSSAAPGHAGRAPHRPPLEVHRCGRRRCQRRSARGRRSGHRAGGHAGRAHEAGDSDDVSASASSFPCAFSPTGRAPASPAGAGRCSQRPAPPALYTQ